MRIARQRPESELQRAVLGVLRGHNLLCWPVNREKGGGRRGAHHVGFAGLPDIAGVVKSDAVKSGAHGLAFFVEVKRPGQSLRPTQVAAHATLRAEGCPVYVATSVEDAEYIARDLRVTAGARA